MKKTPSFVVAVTFLLVCSVVSSWASVVNRVQDPEQLGTIGWQLTQDSFTRYVKPPSKIRDKPLHRQRHTAYISSMQSDLLQELLAADARNADKAEMITIR